MLTIGLDGPITMRSAPAIASSTAGAGRAVAAPSTVTAVTSGSWRRRTK